MQISGFLLLAVLVVGTALGVVLLRNPIHAVLLLSINLAGVAALYLMLQDNGALLSGIAPYVHEFTHDGRHALGVPCH